MEKEKGKVRVEKKVEERRSKRKQFGRGRRFVPHVSRYDVNGLVP